MKKKQNRKERIHLRIDEPQIRAIELILERRPQAYENKQHLLRSAIMFMANNVHRLPGGKKE